MTGDLASSFGPYQIISRLGRGAMGVVYRAVDSRTGRDVALKVMSDIGDDVAGTRFTREGEAVSRMVHRNIVTVYEAGVMEGCPYIAMELLEGITLAQRMAGDEPLSLDAKLDIVAQLCEGLQYAHDHGVVHRDVKPANVWLLKNGGVKLLDFGLAKVAGSTVTRAGCVVGSVAYMSPEQVSGVDVDGRSDLFAAGVILYELLTGQRPFEAETMPGIMHRILHVTPTPVRTFLPSIAPELEEALNKALEKPPDARLPNVGDFGAELRLARYYQPAGLPGGSDEELDRTVLIRPASSTTDAGRAPDSGGTTPGDRDEDATIAVTAPASGASAGFLRVPAPASRIPDPEPRIPDPAFRLPEPESYPTPEATMLREVDPQVRRHLREPAPWVAPVAPAVPVAPVAPPARRRPPADASGTPLARFWPVAAAVLIVAAGYGSWRLFMTPSDVPVTEWSAASAESPSVSPGDVGAPSQPPAVAPTANPSPSRVPNAPRSTPPVAAPAPTLGSAPPSASAVVPEGVAPVDTPRPEAPIPEAVAPVTPEPTPTRPARVEPVGVANVDVRVVGGYDFEVSGCGVTSGRKSEHELQVRAPCSLRLSAPAYRLDATRNIDATSGRVELAAPQLAHVKLRTKYEWCPVILGKHAVAVSPVELHLVAGTYTATIQCPEKVHTTRTFSIEPGRSTVKLDDYIR